MGSSLARALGATLWMDLLLGAILVGTALGDPVVPQEQILT